MAKKNFEEALTQLEQIVEELENNDFSIEKAFKKFEEGMELVKFCQKNLEDTQTKLNILNNNPAQDDCDMEDA